jgi:hypothetical protein
METITIEQRIALIARLQAEGQTEALVRQLEALLLICPPEVFQFVVDTLVSVYMTQDGVFHPKIGYLIENFSIASPYSAPLLKGALQLCRAHHLRLTDTIPACCRREALLPEVALALGRGGLTAEDLQFIAAMLLNLEAWELATSALEAMLAMPGVADWALTQLTMVRLHVGQRDKQVRLLKNLAQIGLRQRMAMPHLQRLLVLLGEKPEEKSDRSILEKAACTDNDKVLDFLQWMSRHATNPSRLDGEPK